MSWAADEWKDGLPARALQKINQIETQFERLKKERDQKQFQLDSVEQAFQNQKRKFEEEKSNVQSFRREIKCLEEKCQELDRKREKLACELQTKEKHVCNVEGQLSHSKQALEAEARKVSQLQAELETAQHDHGQAEQKVSRAEAEHRKLQDLSEQQTAQLKAHTNKIAALQAELSGKGTDSLTGGSVKHSQSDTAIVQTLGAQDTTSWMTEKAGLQAENEKLISELKSLQEKMTDLQKSSSFDQSRDSFHSNTNQSMSRRSGDHFGLGTPSRSGSSSQGPNVFELEQKLKKLQQELQCQRYNAEAAKGAVEQKAKKRELEYKEELHQQGETLRRLEKELSDSKNRMQQEINQAKNEANRLEGQLQRLEQSKGRLQQELHDQQQVYQHTNRDKPCNNKPAQPEEVEVKTTSNSAITETDNTGLSSRVRELEAEKTTLVKQVQELEGQLAAAKQKVSIEKSQSDISNLSNMGIQKESTSSHIQSDAVQAKERSKATEQLQEANNTLQEKLKKLQQELQCQRYNAEAAKTAVEQKAKAKENEYKQEISQQADSLRMLEKEFNDTRNKLQQEVKQFQGEADRLKSQVERLEHDKMRMEKEKAQHQNLIDKAEECQREKAAAEKSVGEKEQQLKSVENKLSQAKQELTDKENLIRNLQQEMKDVKKSASDTQRNCQEETRRIQSEMNSLGSELEQRKKEDEQTKARLTDVKTELDQSHSIIQEKGRQLDLSQKEIHDLKNELQKFASGQDDKLREAAVEKEKMQKDLEGLLGEKDALMKLQMEELEKLKEKLQSAKEQKDKTDVVKNYLMKEKVAVETKLKNLEEESEKQCSELRQIKEALTSEIEKVKGDAESIRSEKEQLLQTKTVLLQTVEQLQDEKSKFDQTLENISMEKRIVGDKLSKSEALIGEVQTKNTTLAGRIEELNSASEKLSCEILALKEKESESDGKLKKAELEQQSSAEQMNALQETLTSLQTDNNRLTDRIQELQKEIDSLGVKLCEVTKRENKLKKDFDTNFVNLNSFQKAKDEAVREKNEACETSKKLLAEQESLERSLKESQDKISDIEKEISQQTSLLEDKEKNIRQLEEQNTSLINQLEDKESHLLAQRKEFDTKLTEAHETNRKAEDRSEGQKSEICSLREELKAAKDMQNQTLMKVDMLQMDLEDKDDLVSALEGQVQTAEQIMTSAKEASESKTKELAEHVKCIADLQAQIDSLEKEVDDRKNEGILQQQQLENQSRALAVKDDELSEMSSKIVAFESTQEHLSDSIRELDDKKKEVVEYCKQITELQQNLDNMTLKLLAKDGEFTKLENNVSNLGRALAEKCTAVTEQEQCIKEQDDKIESLLQSVGQLRSHIKTLEQECLLSQNSMDKKQQNLDVLLQYKKEVLNHKNTELNKLHEINSDLRKQIQLLKTKEKASSSEYQTMLDVLDSKDQKIMSLENEIMYIESSKTQLMQHLDVLEAEKTEMSMKEEKIAAKHSDLAQMFDNQAKELEILKSETVDDSMDCLDNQVASLTQKCDALSMAYKTIEAGVGDLRKSLEDSREENLKLSAAMSAKMTDFTAVSAERDHLAKALKDKAEEVTNVQLVCDIKVKEIEDLHDRLAELERTSGEMLRAQTDEVFRGCAEKEKLEEKLEELQSDLVSGKSEQDQAEGEIDSLRQSSELQKEHYRSEINDLKTQTIALQQSLFDEQLKTSELRSLLSDNECQLKDALAKEKDVVSTLETKVDELTRSSERESALLSSQLDEKEKINSQLREEVHGLNVQLDQLKNLERSQEKANHLKTSLHEHKVVSDEMAAELREQNFSLKQTVNVLETTLAAKEERVSELETKCEQYVVDLEQANGEIENLQDVLAEETGALEAQLRAANDLHSSLEENYRRIKDCQELKDKLLADLKVKCEEQIEKCQNAQLLRDAEQKLNETLLAWEYDKKEIVRLEKEKENLLEECREKNAKASELHQTVSDLETRNAELSQEVSATSVELKAAHSSASEMEQRMSAMTEEQFALKEKLRSMEMEKKEFELASKISAAELKLTHDNVASEQVSSRNQLEKLTSEIDVKRCQLETTSGQVHELEQENAELKTTVQQLESDKTMLQKESEQLKKKIGDLDETISDLSMCKFASTSEVTNAETSLVHAKHRQAELEEELESHTSDLEMAVMDKLELEEQTKTMQDQIKSLRGELNACNKEKDTLCTEKTCIQSDLCSSKAAVETLKLDLQSARDELKAVIVQKLDLENRLSTSEESVKTARTENGETVGEFERLKGRLADAEDMLKDKEGSIQELQERKEELELIEAESREALKIHQEQVDALQMEKAALQIEVLNSENSTKTRQTEIEELMERIASFERMICQKDEEKKTSDVARSSECIKLQKENVDLGDRVDALSGEICELQERYKNSVQSETELQHVVEAKSQDLSSLQNKVEGLEAELSEFNAKYSKLEVEFTTIKEEKERYEKQVTTQEHDKRELLNQFLSLEDVKASLEREKSGVELELLSKVKELEINHQEMQVLRAKLQELESSSETGISKVEALQVQIHKLKLENQDVNRKCEGLLRDIEKNEVVRNELSAVQETLKAAQSEVLELQSSVSAVEMRCETLQRSLDEAAVARDGLEEQLESARAGTSENNLREEVLRLRHDKASQQGKLQLAVNNARQLEKTVTDLHTQITRLEQEKAEVMDQLKTKEQEAVGSVERCCGLIQRLKTAESEKERLTARVKLLAGMVKEARVIAPEPVRKAAQTQSSPQPAPSGPARPGKKRQSDCVKGPEAPVQITQDTPDNIRTDTSCSKPCKSPKLSGLKDSTNECEKSSAQLASPRPRSKLSRKRSSLGTPGKTQPTAQEKEADCKVQ